VVNVAAAGVGAADAKSDQVGTGRAGMSELALLLILGGSGGVVAVTVWLIRHHLRQRNHLRDLRSQCDLPAEAARKSR
jgi:hypothetical protein